MSAADDYTIANEPAAGDTPCRRCFRWHRDGVMFVVRLHFPDGGSYPKHYCSRDCAADDGHGWILDELMPRPQPLTVRAVCEVSGVNRMTWHPSPIEDDRRREHDALTQESRRLNRRDQ